MTKFPRVAVSSGNLLSRTHMCFTSTLTLDLLDLVVFKATSAVEVNDTTRRRFRSRLWLRSVNQLDLK